MDKAENKTVWTYAAVGVMNTGGIRIPIDSAGRDITYSDLLMAQPFENTWDILELNGSCILQVFAKLCQKFKKREKIGTNLFEEIAFSTKAVDFLLVQFILFLARFSIYRRVTGVAMR